MEVLAPVGSIEALKAALIGGANAIYLGGNRFGARRFASNFSDEELAGAVELAHSRGVRVYVTVNTLIKENELSSALAFVALLEEISADAVIVQDRGLLHVIKAKLEIPVHASTQMGIHTPEGAKWALKNGVERVILARELGLEEIAAIKKAVPVGLEVFVHGALCYSFSGQCLFSSFAGGRSGNRGACAQPCRKLYRMGEEEGYLLSTADLFCVDNLPALMEIGVDGVKIEGRMRSPTYVLLASRTYASAIKRALAGDSELVNEREREMLGVAFNRGFTKGYMSESQIMQRNYADSRGLALGEGEVRQGHLHIEAPSLQPGDGVTLYLAHRKIGGFEIGPPVVQDGGHRVPFQLPEGRYQVYKTKDRDFPALEREIASVQFRTKELPRRKDLQLELPGIKRTPRGAELSAFVSSLKVLERVLPFVDRVYFEWAERMEEARALCEAEGKAFVPMLPRVSPRIPESSSESLMVCNVDQAERYRERRLYGHYSLNMFNSRVVPKLHQYMLSVELSQREIAEAAAHFPGRLEMLVFGRIELMVTKDPTIKQGMLVDPQGKRFPVYRDVAGYAHVLNSSDLFLLEFMKEIESMGIESVSVDLRRKAPDLAALVAKSFRERDISKKSAIKRKCGAITTGHYMRGVD